MSDDNKEFSADENQGENVAEQDSSSTQVDAAAEDAAELESDIGSGEAPEAKSSQAGQENQDSEGSDQGDSDSDKEEVLQNGPMFLENELEGAYDFESGELIDDDPHAGIPSRNLVSSAKEFFNTEILYRFDILEDAERKKLTGKYLVELVGDTSESWSVQLDNDLEIVNKAIDDAEVTLKVSERDFILLVNGDLNPQLAFLSEKVKTLGSLDKALSFQSILAPTPE